MSIKYLVCFVYSAGLSSFDLLYLAIGIAIFGLPALSKVYDDLVLPFIMPIGLPIGKVKVKLYTIVTVFKITFFLLALYSWHRNIALCKVKNSTIQSKLQ